MEVATLVCATLVKANEGSSLLINLIQNTVLFFQSPPTQWNVWHPYPKSNSCSLHAQKGRQTLWHEFDARQKNFCQLFFTISRSSKIEIDFLGGPGEDKMPRHSNGKRQVRQRYEFFLYSSPRKRQKPVLFRSHIKCCCRYLTHHGLQLFLASGLTCKNVCVGFNRNPLLLFLSFIKSPRKPEMERKRRQRINKCLSQIKLLIPEAKELEVTMQTRGVVPLRRPVFAV